MATRKFFALLAVLVFSFSFTVKANQPAIIYLKDGGSIEVQHFGQLKCGNKSYSNNFVLIRGKYLGSPTEIKDFSTVEKIILEGFTQAPAASTGNEKSVVRIFKKNGVSVALEDAEVTLSCYGPGDLYNQIVVQIYNPITEKNMEKVIETRSIQSVVFK